MKIIKLGLINIEELLELQKQMYFQKGSWKDLWDKEAGEKFKLFIKDYLKNFPQGCFGLVDEEEKILGAMFLMRTSRPRPIPYLHKVSEHLIEDGEIAYVSFFVVKKGSQQRRVAQDLYDEAEKIALTRLGCKTIAVVIYSSPLEEEVIKGNNYERLDREFEWEIYPDKKVRCWIYYYKLLAKKHD